MKATCSIIFAILMLCPVSAVQSMGVYGKGNPIPQTDILPEGAVRAVVVESESQLPGGPKAEGVVGDFKLYNNHVAFVIAGARPASGIDPFGGVVEDAARRVGDGPNAAWFNLMGDSYLVFFKAGDDPLMNGRLFEPKKAEIVKDGSDGEAIVRVIGRDAEFPMRKEQYGLSSRPLKLRITIDYILTTNGDTLETRVRLQKEKGTMDVGLGMVFLLGDGADVIAPGAGYDIPGAAGSRAPLLGATSEAVSYGWFKPEGDIKINSMFDKIVITEVGSATASEDGADSFGIRLAVGRGDLASVFEQKYAVENRNDLGTISGRCLFEADKSQAPGAVAHIFSSDEKYLSNALCGSEGAFLTRLPEGDYILRAGLFGPAGTKAVGVSIRAGEETAVELPIEAPAMLAFEISDQNDALIPATISLKPLNGTGAAESTPQFRSKRDSGGLITHFTATGQGSIQARPGEYEAYFSRGLEYEYVKKSVALKSGETVSEKITLQHVVDTAGYLSGDFHIHAAPSFDSDDTLQDKLLGIAACGLEVPVSTDHNMRTDYAPVVQELGLERFVKSIVGTELTTTKLGHFNGFPLTYMPSKPNRGAIDWVGMTPGEIFGAMRDDPAEDTVVEVNHPLGSDGGYLTFMGYDAPTAKAVDARFSRDFDAMEILNGGSYGQLETILNWWFSFLNRGFLVAGVGNSDSHGVFALEVGYPRNYVKTDTDIPGELGVPSFIENLHAQRLTTSGGPFILIDADGKGGMGETVTDADGDVDLNIRIQAPSWIDVQTLKIYSTGGLVKSIPIEKKDKVERFNSVVTVHSERDAWYIAAAEGDGDLFPVYPGKHPYAFTNPVYIDVDGNGRYDPPMNWE